MTEAIRRTILGTLYLASFAGLLWLAWFGRDYYLLPLAERPHHALHWELKPGGTFGRLYGVAGATLMVVMLSYSVRRRLPALRKAARLTHWLDFHIWCGVTGPLLIVLHSALKVGGLIAISFWSMVAVALSGIVGRFLYAQIPRTAAGDELSLEQAQRLERELAASLAVGYGLSEREIGELTGAATVTERSTVAASLAALLFAPLADRRRLAAFRRAHRSLPRPTMARLTAMAPQRATLHRRLLLWRRLHELFHYWHVFHKPFAILMYLFAAIHVGVVWATGYGFGAG